MAARWVGLEVANGGWGVGSAEAGGTGQWVQLKVD